MTTIDAKAVGDLIKTFGPSDEDRQKFSRTFLGTLLGQTMVFVGMAVTYVAAFDYAKDHLIALHSTFGTLVLIAPLVCILLFSLLPAMWQAMRERRLKISVIGGETDYKPGYFRLHPYGAGDRDIFKRLDGADTAVLDWLRMSQTSLLYLSGASGVGKSSILAANILPRLREGKWTVVETRLFGDPVESLRKAILGLDSVFARKPAPDTPLRDLLTRAAESCKKRFAAPLLVVIDQFEEFLILHRAEDRLPFTDLLSDLLKNPIDNLRLLLVFRSDYRPLVFKLDLPPLESGKNWQELAPYDRGDAAAFLRSGGRELSPQALDAMFRGLDRIEDTRGIYRPITLNMVGLVLERMGQTLEGDPGHLIQSYLASALASESRDFAKPVLAAMITDAGTKEPHSEAEIATLTGLELWQVRATLADMVRQGLVRRLAGEPPIWEIAHDFLARAIGQLIGRLRPTLVQRARPLVAPAVLLGWVAFAVLALPAWTTIQSRAAETFLRDELHVTYGRHEGGGILVTFPEKTDDTALASASRHLEQLRELRRISLNRTEVTDLEPIKDLTNLTALDLNGATGVTGLEPIKSLTNLTALDLNGATGVTSLEPITSLTNLTALNLGGATGITSLEPIKSLTNLTALSLSGATGISLETIEGLTKLTALDLNEATGITSLEPIKSLTNLTALSLGDVTGVSLEPLRGLTNLTLLSLVGAKGAASLEPLVSLTNLTSLDLRGATSLEPIKSLTNLISLDLRGASTITSLEPIKSLTKLTSLSLSGAAGISLEPIKGLTNLTRLGFFASTITSLEPLRGLTNLTSIDLQYAEITSPEPLEPLRGLTNLTSINLEFVSGITSLEPLRGRKNLRVIASDELLATMK